MDKKKRWFPWPPKKRDDQEIEELRKKIAERPDAPRLHQRLAELLLERGRRSEALDSFVKAAECHAEAGFHVRAIAMYRRVLRMQESPQILLKLAELYLANGYMGDALVEYRKVIQYYRSQGKSQEVFSALRRMADVDPSNLEVRLKYVELLRTEGFEDQALDELIRLYLEQREKGQGAFLRELEEQIHAMGKELEEQMEAQGRQQELAVLRRKMLELALPAVERETLPLTGPTAGPQQVEAEEEIELLEMAEEKEDVLGGLPEDRSEEAREIALEEVAARLQEAIVYEEQGLLEEAEEIYRELLEADPGCMEAREGLGRIEQEKARLGGAQSAADPKKLQELEEQQPELCEHRQQKEKLFRDSRAHYELGLAYRELGLMEEAISELRTACTDPALAFACYRELGVCFRGKGDFVEAVACLRKALQCKGVPRGELLEVGYELAQTLEQQGRPKEALVLYRKIQEADQGFRDVQERVRALSQ